MRGKSLFGIFFAVLVLAMVLGCPSQPPVVPPPPIRDPTPPSPPPDEYPLEDLDTSIMQRVDEYYRKEGTTLPENLDKLQLYISGGIVLERETNHRNDDVQQDGQVLFKDINTPISQTIEDKKEGLAIKMDPVTPPYASRSMTLTLCFENEDEFQLSFTASGEKALFFLDFNETASSDGTKGTLMYGGDKYSVSYTGEQKPYLMIRLLRRYSNIPDPHTAPGRRVNQ